MLCIFCMQAVMVISTAMASIVSFEMVRDQPYTSDIYIGEKNSLTLNVTLNEVTMSEVVIAIVPSMFSTVMAVSKINSFTIGSAVTITGSNVPVNTPGVEYVSNTKVKYLSRVTFDLGNVTTDISSTMDQRRILINFELTMVSARNFTNGSTYWASSGISYKTMSAGSVHICQLSYILHNTFKAVLDPPVVADLTLTTLELGKQTQIQFDISISKPAFSLTVQSITDVLQEEVVTTQLDVVEAGEAFKTFLQFSGLKTKGYISCTPNTTLLLGISELVNKESTAGGPDIGRDKLTLAIGYQTKYDPALVGRTFTVKLIVTVDSDASIIKSSTVLITTRSSTPNFNGPITLSGLSVPVSAGFPALLYLGIPVPSNTNKTYEIRVISAPVTDGKQPALSILAAKLFSYGSNLPCPCTKQNVDITSPTTPSTAGQLVTTFTLLNSGLSNESQASLLIVVLTAMFIKRADVETGNQHTLIVQVREEGGSYVSNSTILTVGNSTEYPSTVVNIFGLSRNCPTSQTISGGFFAVNLTVSTPVNIVNGPMLIETSVIPDNTSNTFSFCSSKIVFAGDNALCVTAGTELKFTYVQGTNNKVALIEVPCVCNINMSSTTSANDFIIEITFKVENNYTNPIYTIGIAVNYSASQYWIWVYQTFIELQETILGNGSMYLITGVYVNTENVTGFSWPESYLLEYKLGQDFITVPDTPNRWRKATNNGTHQEYLMNFPVFANVSRLSPSTNCTGGCFSKYSYRIMPASEVINVYGDMSGVLLLKLNKAFDGDNSTCFQVPIIGQNAPSVLFFNLRNLSLININATKFQINILGQNLVCDRSSTVKMMYVAFPEPTGFTNNFFGNMLFCTVDTVVSGTACALTCDCTSVGQCQEILFFFWNDGNVTNATTVCDIRGVNLV